MRIEFYEQNGRIGVKYMISIRGEEWKMFLSEARQQRRVIGSGLMTDLGLVPEEIQRLGSGALQKFAQKICDEDLARRKQEVERFTGERNERMKNINVGISSPHSQGIILKGHIRYVSPGKVIVCLDEPRVSAEGITFDYPKCFAESMGGIRVFKEDGSLTARLVEDAHRALTHLYDEIIRRQKYGDVIDVVEDLNMVNAHGVRKIH